MNSKQPTVNSRRIASFLVLVIPLALLAYRDIEPQERARLTSANSATRDPQTNSLRYNPTLRFTEADYSRHVNELKARIKKKLSSDESSEESSNEFSIVVQKPFVVIGDEPGSVVQQRAEDTVKWAVNRLKQDFFTKDPEDILDIWLFKDEASYEKHTLLLFGEKPRNSKQ